MRKISFMVIFIFVFLNAASAGEHQEPASKQNLSDLVQEALENNPGLEAAAHRVMSAEKVIPQAGSLPNPKITLGLMNLPVNSFVFDQEPMTGKQISVMQMFPFPGKLSLSADMAEFEAAAVKEQQNEIRNNIVLMVKQAYYDLYAVDRALETVQKNKDMMAQMVQTVEIKYATGSGLQQDVLRAQVELSKLEDDLIMWQNKRLAVVAKLNALLNRPSGTPIDTTLSGLGLPEEQDLRFSQKEIESKRPLILAWKKRLGKSGTAVKLARKEVWPNFSVGVGYSQRDDLKNGTKMHDFFSVSVTLDVPLFYGRKQGQKIAEKELALEAARADFRNVLNGVMAEVESQRAELERNRKRTELYKGGILLQAEQSLESAQAGYQVGKVDFLNVVDNWMRLLRYEMEYHFAVADYHKALARYDFAVGNGAAKAEEDLDL
jgi:outer membrane protein TolC